MGLLNTVNIIILMFCSCLKLMQVWILKALVNLPNNGYFVSILNLWYSEMTWFWEKKKEDRETPQSSIISAVYSKSEWTSEYCYLTCKHVTLECLYSPLFSLIFSQQFITLHWDR